MGCWCGCPQMLWVFSLDLEGFWFVGVYGSDETIVAQATAVGDCSFFGIACF